MPLQNNIPSLILKKLQGTITPEEESVLLAWAIADPSNNTLLKRLLEESEVTADIKAFDKLWGGEDGTKRYNRMEQAVLANTVMPVRNPWRTWLRYAAAAAVFALTAILWILLDNPFTDRASDFTQAQHIYAGGNRATLTLADGHKIMLDEAQSGIRVGDTLMYSDGSEVLLMEREIPLPDRSRMMAISTPRGGQYQITLSDGTRVWLNAESILRYPYKFGDDERVVELAGEGYFIVAKDSNSPFKVVSNRQTIEVLGTEFNIEAYPGESETRTTLVEGKVKVRVDGSSPNGENTTLMLSPSQQAIVGASSARVETTDIAQYTAWKDGFFYFNGDSPKDAFAQLSRWYDIELVYRNEDLNVQFYGKVERNKSLGSLLQILETAGLAFKVSQGEDGYQLIVGHSDH